MRPDIRDQINQTTPEQIKECLDKARQDDYGMARTPSGLACSIEVGGAFAKASASVTFSGRDANLDTPMVPGQVELQVGGRFNQKGTFTEKDASGINSSPIAPTEQMTNIMNAMKSYLKPPGGP